MTLEHRAFLYRGVDDFLAVTVPFLESGLERDEAVIAVAREPNLTALRDTLAPRGASIQYFDSAGFYQHPVRTLRDYQTVVRQSAPRSVCALAEPVWDGLDERETQEWVRYESLINVVFQDASARSLCPYDTSSLPPGILAEARRTHPVVLTDGVGEPSEQYLDPVTLGSQCDRRTHPSRPGTAEYLTIDNDDLHTLRSFVGAHARRNGLAEQPAQNLVTAVNEVAANAIQHGTPPIGLWAWRDGQTLTCEIGDNGCWFPGPSPLTGFIPPDSALQRGFGLWTVRLLVDLMELSAGWDGTFVRLHMHV